MCDKHAGGVEAVVLAAGLSTRSERYKMTLPLGRKTVIERSIEGMYDLVDRIIVVVGWQAERLRAALAGYDKVVSVPNERYRDGMFSSVQAGVAHVRASRFFLQPGDVPLIGSAVYARMLAEEADVVVPVFRGRRGHPVLLSGATVPEILAQPVDSTLRRYIEAKGYEAVEVDDEGILLDLDTPEDYEGLRARSRLCDG